MFFINGRACCTALAREKGLQPPAIKAMFPTAMTPFQNIVTHKNISIDTLYELIIPEVDGNMLTIRVSRSPKVRSDPYETHDPTQAYGEAHTYQTLEPAAMFYYEIQI